MPTPRVSHSDGPGSFQKRVESELRTIRASVSKIARDTLSIRSVSAAADRTIVAVKIPRSAKDVNVLVVEDVDEAGNPITTVWID